MNTQLLTTLIGYYITIGITYTLYVITDLLTDDDEDIKYLVQHKVNEMYQQGNTESRIRWTFVLAMILAGLEFVVTWPIIMYNQFNDDV